MDSNATRPISPPQKLVYRCACSESFTVDPTVGGRCPSCDRTVSPKLIEHNYSLTVVVDDENFELEPTLPGPLHPTSSQRSDTDSIAPEVLIGKRFGHFEIIEPLGRGGMGQVYRALDTSLQRYVAVKVLRSGIDQSTPRSSDLEIDKLLAEAVSQARVSHPNIVTIFYVGKQDGNPFLAMELVNGETLSQRIARSEMSFDEVAPIILDIANALKVSYEFDILHGDIKPSNVLISQNGTAKLSDFGMARSASKDSGTSIGGTPNYIAPEILKEGKPSIRSDIYALGVTFFEMTFGELPLSLSGHNIKEWIKRHESYELVFPTPWPARLPEKWKDVLSFMLAKEPEERYPSYEALIDDLELLQPGSTEVARFLPRLIAAGIDWITVLALTLGLQMAFTFSALGNSILPSTPITSFFINVVCLLPIVVYTAIIYFWRQSLGRSLMHLRIINQYGLKPTSKEVTLRSLFRMQFPWWAIVWQLFGDTHSPVFQLSLSVLLAMSGVLLILDIGFMMINANGRSIHDLLNKTKVVLDTRIVN